MPNIAKLLEQNDAGFKRYTGIHKATIFCHFYGILFGGISEYRL